MSLLCRVRWLHRIYNVMQPKLREHTLVDAVRKPHLLHCWRRFQPRYTDIIGLETPPTRKSITKLTLMVRLGNRTYQGSVHIFLGSTINNYGYSSTVSAIASGSTIGSGSSSASGLAIASRDT